MDAFAGAVAVPLVIVIARVDVLTVTPQVVVLGVDANVCCELLMRRSMSVKSVELEMMNPDGSVMTIDPPADMPWGEVNWAVRFDCVLGRESERVVEMWEREVVGLGEGGMAS
jgi:hypothetical protein